MDARLHRSRRRHRNPNLVIWDESAQDWSTPSSLTASLSTGQGFLLHVYEDDEPETGGTQGGFPKTILVRDEVNTLPQTINLSYTNGADSNYDGFNLAANPSASTIDWEQVTRNNVTDTYYVWDPAGGHYDTYQSGVGGTNGGSQYIAPFQGFWIQASTTGASFTVDSTDVASTDGTLYKQSSPVSSVLLHLENDEGRSDEVRLVVREQAGGDDDLYDAPKLAPLSERYLSLAILADSLSLAIDSRPKAQTLHYDLSVEAANTSGKAVLSLTENNLPDDWAVELVNTSTGERYNLIEETVFLEIAGQQRKASGGLNHPMKAVTTSSSGWQVQITTAPTDKEQNTLPAEFSLAQNYPNPFNPSTVISYQ